MVLPASSSKQARRLVALVTVLVALGSALLVGGARSAEQGSGLIAFTRPDGIYVMHADGSGPHPLSRAASARSAAELTWSPDGSRLAYVTFDWGKRTQGGVWVMNANGSHPVLIAKVSFAPSRPTWSPDSKQVAFAQPPGAHNAIWTVNADGTGLRRIVVPGMPRVGIAAVSWSPDGSRFAIAAGGWTIPGGGIYLARTNGTGLHPLVPGGKGEAGEPVWSPDGEQIVYTSALPRQVKPHFWSLEQRDEEISTVDVRTGEHVQLTHNGVPDHTPSWSPDGSRIVFVGAYARPQQRSVEIYTINPDGTGFTRLTHDHGIDANPAWQPTATTSGFKQHTFATSSGKLTIQLPAEWRIHAEVSATDPVHTSVKWSARDQWEKRGTTLAEVRAQGLSAWDPHSRFARNGWHDAWGWENGRVRLVGDTYVTLPVGKAWRETLLFVPSTKKGGWAARKYVREYWLNRGAIRDTTSGITQQAFTMFWMQCGYRPTTHINECPSHNGQLARVIRSIKFTA